VYSRLKEKTLTKIAYISDVHLEFRNYLVLPIIDGDSSLFGEIGFPDTLDADILVVAGDIHPNKAMRDRFKAILEKKYGIPVVTVDGNHDYYGSVFPTEHGDIQQVAGLTVATTSLWTYLGPMEEMMAHRFTDFQHIKDISVSRWNYLHMEQSKFLRDSKADIIVTHHAPSEQSIAQQFKGNAMNGFFASNQDLGLFPNTKLWVHGHVHNVFDYIQDGVRVVCNPKGYPFEKHCYPVAVKVVEI
jgi:Icc-related predicted phosphoesterase